MRSIALLLAMTGLLSVPSAAIAEVYRCTEDGKTVYSDRPCRSGASQRLATPSATSTVGGSVSTPQSEANLGRVVPGQTPAQVEQAWGRPKTRNIDTSKSGRSEQWVYERSDGTGYVYFKDGLVSSYSVHLERDKPSESAVGREPTREEIEAQERSAKAGERKFVTNSSRLSREQMRARLGEPDQKSFANGLESWVYQPSLGDPWTETRILFDPVSGESLQVDRIVRR